MSTLRSDWPSTPDFHPEFGLLCPSPRRRRGMRLAAVSIVAGMAVGVTMGLAVAHWRDHEVAPSPEAGSIEQEPLTEGPAIHVVLDLPVASSQPSKSDVDELTVRRPQGCKLTGANGLATVFLNPACDAAKSHAKHTSRTVPRVATVIVGRTESPSTQPEPMPIKLAAIDLSHAAADTAGKAVIPASQPVERSAPPKKPKAAPGAPIALTPPTREPTQQYVGSLAFAAVPRGSGYFGSEYSERPGDLFHAAAMPPSSGGPFGGIW